MVENLDVDALLARVVGECPTKSLPGAWYNPDGDCIFYFAEDVDYFAERVDKILTVYRAEDDSRIIGVEIKGLSKLPEHDRMQIELGSDKPVAIVNLMLISVKPSFRTLPPASHEAYLDALTSMVGKQIPKEELEAALVSR